MTDAAPPHEDLVGVVGSVGRTHIELALVAADGRLRTDTIRSYTTKEESLVSGAIGRFCREAGVPQRCRMALAVAGVVRDDAIRITNTQWIVSKSGIASMIGGTPVLVNDFAAKAWALAGSHGVTAKPLGAGMPAADRVGTRCLVGISGDGVGVAAFSLDEGGRPSVIASEGGASALPSGALPADLNALVVAGGSTRIQSDTILSASGVVAIYTALCRQAGRTARWQDGIAILRAASHQDGDPFAIAAAGLFCDALAGFVSNLVLVFGAWDGVYLTGGLVEAIPDRLQTAMRSPKFAPPGAHARRLAHVPLAFAKFDHGELAGAAIALRTASPSMQRT